MENINDFVYDSINNEKARITMQIAAKRSKESIISGSVEFFKGMGLSDDEANKISEFIYASINNDEISEAEKVLSEIKNFEF